MFAYAIELAPRHLTKYFAAKYFRQLAIKYCDCRFCVRYAAASPSKSQFGLNRVIP
jgi:hypothetical protein